MSNSVISGLVGGLVALVLTTWIASKVGKSAPNGELRFGKFLWFIGLACVAMALLPVAITVFAGHSKDTLAKILLSVGFGAGAIYCFGEVVFVHGRFDEEGISFHSPWTGAKSGKWRNLQSIEHNDWTSWYALTFQDGTVIRLSSYLSGHLAALEAASAFANSGGTNT
jgi:hypothetical protein